MKQFDHYTSTDKMRDLIQHNNALIMVLARFDIPLGFGEKTVDEICQSHNIDTNTFLEVANFVSNNSFDYTNISVKSLINYLKKAHDYYLEFSLPAIRRKLIEAIDLAHSNEISILIIRLYDEYVNEVKRHMGYENNVVFRYVDNLLQKYLNRNYTISTFAGKHSPIGDKLTQLKDAIICYFPEKNNYLLNDVLLDIMICEQDLASHCKIEDRLFVPAVELEEIKLKNSGKAKYSDDKNKDLSYKEKSDSLSQREKDIIACVAKGMSNKEIADALFLSVHTVTTHRRNIAAKLQIHSPSGITIYAIVNHLIRIEDIK